MSDSPVQYPEVYSSEDIQQIIQIALARQGEDDELTRKQLWEIADELNIDLQTLQVAENQWLQYKNTAQKRQAFDLYRRNQFKQKTIKYSIVNGFLISLNLITTGGISWSLYILLFFGLGLALDWWKTFHSKDEEYERAFQRWSFQNEVKQTFNSIWQKLYNSWQS
ncbi:conserved hypothetical protein [Hyella patelloides LEGE 07179]|uniref:2TM domain-containing protein n=1 Tax=Hyella patelloides LEGE 07179 TaxID=945734 RepID=A0A563W199_9CYAN|nr:2TM domain-containing protein [Hyella patelloides]VEP17468.1 conserved hypothetical protein [Hyella patelloides LEGE 07179]